MNNLYPFCKYGDCHGFMAAKNYGNDILTKAQEDALTHGDLFRGCVGCGEGPLMCLCRAPLPCGHKPEEGCTQSYCWVQSAAAARKVAEKRKSEKHKVVATVAAKRKVVATVAAKRNVAAKRKAKRKVTAKRKRQTMPNMKATNMKVTKPNMSLRVQVMIANAENYRWQKEQKQVKTS